MRHALKAAFFALALLAPSAAMAQALPAAISQDEPMDKAHPAATAVLHIPTHGLLINGLLYKAAGAGPHHTVILFHGLPGNEQNLDLAQAMRRDGWTVLTLHYRGTWGSPGVFSFANELEDGQAVLDFLRDPANAAKYDVDPNHIVLAGHSVGGLIAALTGAKNPGVQGVVMISAADLGARASPDAEGALTTAMAGNMETLAGTSAKAMAQEIIAHKSVLEFVQYAPALAHRPLLLITSNDGTAPSSDALGQKVKALGGSPTEVHLPTDHVYSGQRIALETAVLVWLESLPKR
jgi:pimeloyl-ACP methyl ester carboxylesterase